MVVSKQCLLDVLDIITHWRNMHDMCPHPLQIRLPYVLLEVIGNKKNQAGLLHPEFHDNKIGISLSVVTHAAAAEHCYADSFSYFL